MTEAQPRPSRASSVLVLTTVRLLSTFAGFLASVLGARLIGPSGMGSVGESLTIAIIGAVVGSGGLNISAIFVLNRRPADRRSSTARLLLLGLIATLVAGTIVLVGGLAGRGVLTSPLDALIAAAPLTMSIVAFELCGAILLGLGDERAYVRVQAVEAVTSLGYTGIVLLAVSRSPAGFLTAATFGYVTATVLAMAVTLRRVGRVAPAWDRGFAREMLGLGLRGQVGNVLQYLNLRLDLLLVPTLAGLAAAGAYLIAVRVSEVVLLVANSAGTLLFPRVAAQADLAATGATEALVRSTMLLVLIGAAAIALIAEPLLTVVFGPEFAPGAGPTRILALAMLPLALSRLLGGDLRGRGRPGLVSWSAGVALLVTIVADIALIPSLGIGGAALASLLAYSTGAVFVLVSFTRVTGASPLRLVPRIDDARLLVVRGWGLLSRLPGPRTATTGDAGDHRSP